MALTRTPTDELRIRRDVPADRRALNVLAERDSHRLPSGRLLLAQRAGGGLIAAVSLDGDDAIADPFLASGPALALLRLRAAQMSEGETDGVHGRRGRLARVWTGLVKGAETVPLAGR